MKTSPTLTWCLVAACASLGCSSSASEEGERADIFTVKRGPLPIRVTEQAEIQPLTSTRIKNEMEGSSTIIYLIPEGTVVEQGQKLVELDASELEERKAQQEITLSKADAARVSAREELEIRHKEFDADKLAGENAVKIAQIDMEKYLGKELPDGTRDMGEREQALVEAQANIQLADAELKLALNTLEWSKKLYEKGFITKDEIEKDQLEHQRRAKNLRVARNELDILTKFTHPKEEIRLKQAISQADTDLEGIIGRGKSRLAQGRADLEAKEKEYELALERFQNLETQIKNAIVRAPTPGLVIYASEGGGRGRQEFVEEGATVRERQTLIELPDVTRMVATLKVHEASVDKVRPGQHARVTVDAFTDREFAGVVRRVSPVADSGSRWSNNGLKVYKTEVELDGQNLDLKPGMSASVTIIVAELENVLFVPLQAVHRQGVVTFVWVDTPEGPVAKEVELGLNDFQFVEVTAGLEEGAHVYLASPPGAVEPEFEQPESAVATPQREATPTEGGPSDASVRMPAGGSDDPAGAQRPAGSSAMDTLNQLLEQKYPQLAQVVASDRRAWFTNDELKQALESDDELRAARDAMVAEMRARFGNRGNGDGGGGRRGEGRRRGRGEGGEGRRGRRGDRSEGGEGPRRSPSRGDERDDGNH